jgi:hypothetical protein
MHTAKHGASMRMCVVGLDTYLLSADHARNRFYMRLHHGGAVHANGALRRSTLFKRCEL